MSGKRGATGTRLRPAVKRLGGIGFALALLLVLEGSLSLLPLERFDRLFVPGKAYPLFVPGEDELSDFFVTSPHFKGAFNPQSFRRVKPKGTIRVFVLGGSAAMGWPGGDPFGFSGYLRRALDSAMPGRFEIVNACGHSYGSRRVLDVLSDVIAFEPDLVLVYCGNNEYVERNVLTAAERRGGWAFRVRDRLRSTATYRAFRVALFRIFPSALRRPAEEDITDLRARPMVRRGSIGRTPEVDREVLAAYQDNLGEMAALLDRQKIPGVFFTIPVNLAQWAPTGISPRLETEEKARQWQDLVRDSELAIAADDLDGAQALLLKAIELSPTFAPAHYALGWIHLRRGLADAGQMLSTARDLDARPLRALSTFNRSLLSLADRGQGTAVLDLDSLFQARSSRGVAGRDLFLDYCHPNEDGHKLIASALLPVLAMAAGSALPGTELEGIIAADDAAARRGTDEMATWYYAQGMTLQNQNDLAGATVAYLKALEFAPEFPEALGNLGILSRQAGALPQAEAYFRRALTADPGNVTALHSLAQILAGSGDADGAQEAYRTILSSNTPQPEAMEDYALLLLADGGPAMDALSLLRRALDLGRDTASVHRGMGMALRSLGDTEEARREFREALAIDPLDGEARRHLAELGGGR